jgi:hypothetical protein
VYNIGNTQRHIWENQEWDCEQRQRCYEYTEDTKKITPEHIALARELMLSLTDIMTLEHGIEVYQLNSNTWNWLRLYVERGNA